MSDHSYEARRAVASVLRDLYAQPPGMPEEIWGDAEQVLNCVRGLPADHFAAAFPEQVRQAQAEALRAGTERAKREVLKMLKEEAALLHRLGAAGTTEPPDMAATLEELREAAANARAELAAAVVAACPGEHRPVQHRDMRPPWCRVCGRGADGAIYKRLHISPPCPPDGPTPDVPVIDRVPPVEETLRAVRHRWSTYGGMGNAKGADDYTDAGCRLLAEHAFRDVAYLLSLLDAYGGAS